jgi:hypothetical protein
LNGTASSGGGAAWPSAGNTWQSFGGNGGVTNSGSLSYGPLLTGGNHADFQRFDVVTASIRSMAANQGGAGRDLWVSMLMNPAANDQGMALNNGSVEEVFVGTPGGTGFAMRLDSGVTGGGTVTLPAAPPVAATGATHFVGLHLSLTTAGASTVTLYVDPDVASLGTGSAPTGGSIVTYSTANPFPFESVAIGNAGPVGTIISFDEFRLGSSWADVSPVAVPEPSTLLLAGGGLAAVARRRRPNPV